MGEQIREQRITHNVAKMVMEQLKLAGGIQPHTNDNVSDVLPPQARAGMAHIVITNTDDETNSNISKCDDKSGGQTYNCISSPLGSELPSKIKQKKLNSEYVNFGELLSPSDRERVQVVIPTGRYSDRSIFRQVVSPTGR